MFVNGSDLHQVDLTNGHTIEIVPSGVWWLSLSPDETMVAYIRWNGAALDLILHDLATGAERLTQLEAKYSQAGDIVWSPNGETLILTMASHPCEADWAQSVVRVDVATLSQTSLIRDDERLFSTVEWPEAGRCC